MQKLQMQGKLEGQKEPEIEQQQQQSADNGNVQEPSVSTVIGSGPALDTDPGSATGRRIIHDEVNDDGTSDQKKEISLPGLTVT